MNENIDWEDMMTKAERSATGAAMNAERAVGGVAKVLEIQRHHSQQLLALKKALETLAHEANSHRSQPIPTGDNAQGEAEVSFRLLALGFAVVLAVGMGFGAYIAN
ncbi:hypothetical protein [Pelagovum pacificum]|uniref:hypothetical protein n=1 Tax=Pelagovum pacificum TaxID=2588711 RepID=UPI001E40E677|nr:hypothetical protein [Pelagovum pacificum]